MPIKPKMSKRNQMSAILISEYGKMEDNLKNYFKIDSKISFSVNAWSGLNKKSYYSVTIESKGGHSGAEFF